MTEFFEYSFPEPEDMPERMPMYLRDPDPQARSYGTLSYNRRSRCWTIKAEPCVTELAKRLFPGCDGKGRGVARFTAHRRTVGDLNWLMLRYPLEIKESDRAKAMAEELAKMGASLKIEENSVEVCPCRLTPPKTALCGHNDHRIVMALSVLLTHLGGEIEGAEAVAKSYPDFFEILTSLDAEVEYVTQ